MTTPRTERSESTALGWAILIIVAVFTSVVAATVTTYITQIVWEQHAIEAGAGKYNETTGQFEWKDQ